MLGSVLWNWLFYLAKLQLWGNSTTMYLTSIVTYVFVVACVIDAAPTSSPTLAVATFKVNFSQLYETICETLKEDQTTLLLYLLLHRNIAMKAFILSRTSMDSLVGGAVCLVQCGWFSVHSTLSPLFSLIVFFFSLASRLFVSFLPSVLCKAGYT